MGHWVLTGAAMLTLTYSYGTQLLPGPDVRFGFICGTIALVLRFVLVAYTATLMRYQARSKYVIKSTNNTNLTTDGEVEGGWDEWGL